MLFEMFNLKPLINICNIFTFNNFITTLFKIYSKRYVCWIGGGEGGLSVERHHDWSCCKSCSSA